MARRKGTGPVEAPAWVRRFDESEWLDADTTGAGAFGADAHRFCTLRRRQAWGRAARAWLIEHGFRPEEFDQDDRELVER